MMETLRPFGVLHVYRSINDVSRIVSVRWAGATTLNSNRTLQARRYNRQAFLAEFRSTVVLKWLLTLVIVVLLLGTLTPSLRRLGFGRMPGDIMVQRGGRQYFFPIGSTVILSLLASLIFWMLR